MISFVGITNPYSVGKYSVNQNARVLQRYRFIHEGLMRVQAGQIPVREDWDLKVALCKHLYEDAEAAQSFRTRIPQLRTSSTVLNREPDANLSLLMDELIHARNDLELAEALYGLIKPALLEAYKRHVQNTQQIVDQPTIRMLTIVIQDLEDQISWGHAMLAELRRSGVYPSPDEFLLNLSNIITHAGGMDGLAEKPSSLPERWRSNDMYKLPQERAPVYFGL